MTDQAQPIDEASPSATVAAPESDDLESLLRQFEAETAAPAAKAAEQPPPNSPSEIARSRAPRAAAAIPVALCLRVRPSSVARPSRDAHPTHRSVECRVCAAEVRGRARGAVEATG